VKKQNQRRQKNQSFIARLSGTPEDLLFNVPDTMLKTNVSI